MSQMEISIGHAEMQNPQHVQFGSSLASQNNNLQILGSNYNQQPIYMQDNLAPGQFSTINVFQGKQPMREQSMEQLQFDDRSVQENGGDAQPGESHKVQRTQLTKLQPAGGSTMSVTQVPPPHLPEEQFEIMMQQEAQQMKGQQRQLSAQGLNEPNVNKQFIKKRGLTTKFLTEDEERQYMVYKMITDLFNFEILKKQKNFAIKRYKESLYRGEVITGMRQGIGICVYENGRVYEGSWDVDKRHGKGYERFSNGNQYLGDYEYGRVCGKGLYTWKNQDTYDGEWVDGIKHGYGVWKGITGDSYIGQWVQNKAHGYGVHEWGNGDQYEGEWKYCLRHGQGSDTFANGDVYLGEYNYGKANGYGQYKWANGNTYSGIFNEGMKQGKGVWKKSATDEQTNMYEGEYHQDMKHGLGEFRWASGGFYRGGYHNDIKTGYGEMYWADGSIYRGQWDQGIQNGLGIMIFSNGTRKAGIFKENVLIELLIDQSTVDQYDYASGGFPEAFKQELKDYIGQMNPKENNEQYLEKVLKEPKVEDQQQPNVLLEMQEIANAPWQQQEGNPGLTRDEYIDFIKEQELLEEQQNFEPPRMEIPTVKEFGVQCSPPTPPPQPEPSPKPPSLNIDMQEQMMLLNDPSGFIYEPDERQTRDNYNDPYERHTPVNYIDPNERQTPVNYNDPNDHRNYENYLPPLNLHNNNTADDLVYHDFDYIGYQRQQMAEQVSTRKAASFKSVGVGNSPKQKSMKSIGTIMSPRVMSNKGVARRDNHGGANPIRIQPHLQPRLPLPDIVKRGPVNRQPIKRTIVGLSLQNQNNRDDVRSRRSRGPPLRVQKRNSIETTVRSQKPKAHARATILRAQQAANKYPQPLAPPKKPRVAKSGYKPEYRMPHGQRSNRTLSVPPQYSTRNRSESRGSITPSRRNTALKPLLNQRAWIPGGHPNSMGRNKLASLGKPLNLQYQQSVRSTNELSHSHGRSNGRFPSTDELQAASKLHNQSFNRN